MSPAAAPDRDRTETGPVPEDCSGCGSDLSDGTDAGRAWTQIWDTPEIRLENVQYLTPSTTPSSATPGCHLSQPDHQDLLTPTP